MLICTYMYSVVSTYVNCITTHLFLATGPARLSAAEGGAPVRQSACPATNGGLQGDPARSAEGHSQYKRRRNLRHTAKHQIRRG